MSSLDINIIRETLNVIKNKLNIKGFEILASQSPFKKHVAKLKRDIKGQNVTQGWLKCMEILLILDVDSRLVKMKNLNIFCNAELPGSFLMAINHYCAMKDIKFNWMISSYYTKKADLQARSQENTTDDLLQDVYKLKINNPKNVIFGEIEIGYLDNNDQREKSIKVWNDGDLTNPKTPFILSELVNNSMGKVDLYTSDGGKDIKGKENKEEEINLTLKDGEFRTAYYMMNKGAVCIIKIFTIFTPYMQSLIITFKRLFEECTLMKPFTSNPTNSEVYFIGMGYIPTNIVFPKEVIPNLSWVTFTQDETEWLNKHIFQETNRQITAIESLLEGNLQINTYYPEVTDIDPDKYIPVSYNIRKN